MPEDLGIWLLVCKWRLTDCSLKTMKNLYTSWFYFTFPKLYVQCTTYKHLHWKPLVTFGTRVTPWPHDWHKKQKGIESSDEKKRKSQQILQIGDLISTLFALPIRNTKNSNGKHTRFILTVFHSGKLGLTPDIKGQNYKDVDGLLYKAESCRWHFS